ncbi:MAG: methylmalonyl-CoA mutase family protein [Candidatus Hydrogenedentes bacterium]|nr:methylmalonyl-CoA mutase family protein [Candidatus Hydrogenedentota bacterium]
MKEIVQYRPKHHLRVVTATSLFDGHDAAINIMRRVLQDSGAEVIHLGHNRSVAEIVDAAIQEDAHAIAVSSYQGGHIEFFQYIVDLLRERDAAHIKVFGGGGGVIVPSEIRQIESMGVSKIYSPEDGRTLGLQGMINDLLQAIDAPMDFLQCMDNSIALTPNRSLRVARFITAIEEAHARENGLLADIRKRFTASAGNTVPVLGVTGTGGAGKSSLVDELVTRFLNDFVDKTVAVLSVDPTRQRTGGALLGDRIRMNVLDRGRVYMRSLATRTKGSEISASLSDAIAVVKSAGYDLVIVETAGIGQGDAGIVPLVDISLYVMTAEFGAPTQLEKIDMLDFAHLVAINKFERKGSEDALRHVRKQYQRNHKLFDTKPEDMPVYGTIASKFNDDGVTALYHGVLDALNEKTKVEWKSTLARPAQKHSSSRAIVVPPERVRYLAEIAESIRRYREWAEDQARIAEQLWQLDGALALLNESDAAHDELVANRSALARQIQPECTHALQAFEQVRADYAGEEHIYKVRNREVRTPLYRESLSGLKLPRVALPRFRNPGDLLRWILLENVPGSFPFTAGVFPFKRADEDPTRMFAGEGDPARTNRRFKYLSRNSEAKRLSTAFDSVTLYGFDPNERPDIYGKVGTSGVSIATLDDMKVLYDGFDLCAPNTSVSMTINGPAPIILAMFLNTAIDQQLAKFESENGRKPSATEAADIRAKALRVVRGTVQADILKEDQAQNTCIFSIDIALRMMGDIQQYFVEHEVRNFYSVSISGFHMAEAGCNPISQVAFTLANGFTFVEYYLSRGMHIDEFAPNLSFFFSSGMDPEYAVLNRVARRIWAIAMRDKYGANERSQKFKVHIQTSGRSLHSQEYEFNDIRTTLQALMALNDNCNSLHTNAFDEAVTTPSESSVRRALAIQQIINKEFGIYGNENPLQGSFVIDELSDLVEDTILQEFERLSDRGGVLGAMETDYQRAKIQEESLHYESLKTSGAYPIVGVNCFLNSEENVAHETEKLDLMRATEDEKRSQLHRLRDFHARQASESPPALRALQQAALSDGNIFAELMQTVRTCSLGQITQALFEVGGRYRRSM